MATLIPAPVIDTVWSGLVFVTVKVFAGLSVTLIPVPPLTTVESLTLICVKSYVVANFELSTFIFHVLAGDSVMMVP